MSQIEDDLKTALALARIPRPPEPFLMSSANYAALQKLKEKSMVTGSSYAAISTGMPGGESRAIDEEERWEHPDYNDRIEAPYTFSRELHRLIGKTVRRVLTDEAHTLLAFECVDDSVIVFVVTGDCCSDAWIEHVSHVGTLTGTEYEWRKPDPKPVRKIEEVELGAVLPTKQESDALYGIRIFVGDSETESCNIEFRSSSNGYYGAEISYRGNELHPSVKWIDITKEGF